MATYLQPIYFDQDEMNDNFFSSSSSSSSDSLAGEFALNELMSTESSSSSEYESSNEEKESPCLEATYGSPFVAFFNTLEESHQLDLANFFQNVNAYLQGQILLPDLVQKVCAARIALP